VFVLNGLIFLLIGLQLPAITSQLGETSLLEATLYGLVISFVLITTRLAITLGTSAFTTFVSRFITVADPHPGWKNPLILGWAGMRGVISLAMALSVPLLVADGQAFPFRNLILFVTFVVILVTLVLQGLTLPWLIRKVNPEDKYSPIPKQEQELIIQKKISRAAIQFLEENYAEQVSDNHYLEDLLRRVEIEVEFHTGSVDENDRHQASVSQRIYLDLLQHQREVLQQMNQSFDVDEELIRKYLRLIDLEEIKVRERHGLQ
jgi:CPA1 family monovalent cation:H+ antiporter